MLCAITSKRSLKDSEVASAGTLNNYGASKLATAESNPVDDRWRIKVELYTYLLHNLLALGPLKALLFVHSSEFASIVRVLCPRPCLIFVGTLERRKLINAKIEKTKNFKDENFPIYGMWQTVHAPGIES